MGIEKLPGKYPPSIISSEKMAQPEKKTVKKTAVPKVEQAAAASANQDFLDQQEDKREARLAKARDWMNKIGQSSSATKQEAALQEQLNTSSPQEDKAADAKPDNWLGKVKKWLSPYK